MRNIENRLKQLEETSKDFWNIPPETGNLLSIIIKSSSYKNVVEVGTSNGYSAIWLSDALKATGGHLVTIEFYQKRIDLAVENVAYCELSEYVTFKKGSASEVLGVLSADDFEHKNTENSQQFIDLAFVDACKGEYLDYFNIIDPQLKKGGIFAADNVISHKKSMINFLDMIDANSSYQVLYFPFGGGILLALKLV